MARIVDAGGLVVVSHSGGKDSQAMMAAVAGRVPHRQLLVVHAPLGRVEWPGTVEHIEATIPAGVPLVMARMASGKGLLDRVRERGRWPDPARRWCTSDFKRGPIEREVRRWLRDHPEFGGRVVSCMGLRAEESPARARARVLVRSERKSRAGRDWWDWLPVHDWRLGEVLGEVERAGQTVHWAYGEGMTRLSCSFCIMSSVGDLRTAAKLRPGLFREYVSIEAELGHTLSPSRRSLAQICGGGQ